MHWEHRFTDRAAGIAQAPEKNRVNPADVANDWTIGGCDAAGALKPISKRAAPAGTSIPTSLDAAAMSRHPFVDFEDRESNKMWDAAEASGRHKANNQDPRDDEGTLLGYFLGDLLAAQIRD